MLTADLIVLIAFIACLFIGSAFGFGKVLGWVTGGIAGKIIAVVVCYFIYGIVLDWGFVRALMEKLVITLQEDGSFICKVLLAIRIDMIAFFAVLFVAVLALRKLAVKLIDRVMDSDNKVIRVTSRGLGAILLTTFAAIVMLVIFQLIAWVYGLDGAFYESLQGSAFGLDAVFINNPLNSIFQSIRLPSMGGTPSA